MYLGGQFIIISFVLIVLKFSILHTVALVVATFQCLIGSPLAI